MQLKESQITEIRNRILKEQGGVCAICGMIPERACLDHSHITGRVRGVLCTKCNTIEGAIANKFKFMSLDIDYIDWLDGLKKYLNQPETDMIHPSEKTKKIKRFKALTKVLMIKQLEEMQIEIPEKADRSDLLKLFKKSIRLK